MKNDIKINNLLLYSIFFITLMGSAFHFVYDLTGKIKLVGIFVPINESVFEHLKLAFYPVIIWYFAFYFIYKRKLNLKFSKVFTLMTISILISIILILALYYTYTGALGISSTFLDIFIYFLAITIAQLIIIKFYKRIIFTTSKFYLSLAIIITLAVSFTIFTFYPPNIPIFIEKNWDRKKSISVFLT